MVNNSVSFYLLCSCILQAERPFLARRCVSFDALVAVPLSAKSALMPNPWQAHDALFQVINRYARTLTNRQFIVRHPGKHQICHRHSTACIEGFNATFVDEETQLRELSVCRCDSNGLEMVAEISESACCSVHTERVIFGLIGHDHLLRVGIAEGNRCRLCLRTKEEEGQTSWGGRAHLGTTEAHQLS